MNGKSYLILTGILLGTIGIWVKLIGDSVSPFLLTAFRTLFAAALVAAMIIASKKNKDAR